MKISVARVDATRRARSCRTAWASALTSAASMLVAVPLVAMPLVFALALPVLSSSAFAQSSPLVGNWTWTDKSGCAEIYSYGPDGNFAVTSGEEETSGNYTLSPVADSNGFRLVTGITDRGNGKADCAGRVADEGEHDFMFFVAFHPRKPILLVCQQPTPERCIGPFEKTEEVAPGPGHTGLRR